MNSRTILYAGLAVVFLVVLVVVAALALSSPGAGTGECEDWQELVVTRAAQLAGAGDAAGRSADQHVAAASIEIGERPADCSIEGLGARLVEAQQDPPSSPGSAGASVPRSSTPSPNSGLGQGPGGGSGSGSGSGPSASQLTDECNRWRAAVKNTAEFRAAADGNKQPLTAYLEQAAEDFSAGQPAGCTTAGLI